MRLDTLQRPLSIESVHDGGVYALNCVPMTLTNLFLRVGLVDELFIKLPSPRGWGDYRSFLRFAQPHPLDIRPLEAAERFENLPRTLARFPTLCWLSARDPEIAHGLAVHRLQCVWLHGMEDSAGPEQGEGVSGQMQSAGKRSDATNRV